MVVSWVIGGVVLHCMQRMQYQMVVGESLAEHEDVERTLWLSELPRRDTQTGEWFTLNSLEFKEVEELLYTELKKEVYNPEHKLFLGGLFEGNLREVGDGQRRRVADPKKQVRVHVAPLVESAYYERLRSRRTRERHEAFRELRIRAEDKNQCLRAWYYSTREKWCKPGDVVHARLSAKGNQDKMRMSGSAFVTFTSRERRDLMFRQRTTMLFGTRNYIWNFGKVPFASVTLKCQQAMHPDDVNWLNLQISDQERFGRSASLVIFFLAILLLTNPVIWSSSHLISFSGPTAEAMGVLELWVMNSIIFPLGSRMIAVFMRPVRNSTAETTRFAMNIMFLVVNAVILLLACQNWTAWDFAVALCTSLFSTGHFDWTKYWKEHANWVSSRSTAMQMIVPQYMIVAALWTNAQSLFFRIHFRRFYSHFFSVTDQELRVGKEPPEFDWGYSYALAMCVVFMAIPMSIFVPLVLPCAWFFFLLTHKVDMANLNSDSFSLESKEQTDYGPTSLLFSRLVMAFVWMVLGVYICVGVSLQVVWSSIVPHTWVFTGAVLLCLASLFLLVSSCSVSKSMLPERRETEQSCWTALSVSLLSCGPKLFTTAFPSLGRPLKVRHLTSTESNNNKVVRRNAMSPMDRVRERSVSEPDLYRQKRVSLDGSLRTRGVSKSSSASPRTQIFNAYSARMERTDTSGFQSPTAAAGRPTRLPGVSSRDLNPSFNTDNDGIASTQCNTNNVDESDSSPESDWSGLRWDARRFVDERVDPLA